MRKGRRCRLRAVAIGLALLVAGGIGLGGEPLAERLEEWLLFSNPLKTPAQVSVEFFAAGARRARLVSFTMAPRSRFTFFVNDVPGLRDAEGFFRAVADVPIVAELAMTGGGAVGGGAWHANGTPSPSPVWYFAEGRVVMPEPSCVWYVPRSFEGME
jgi:hypothetical protein